MHINEMDNNNDFSVECEEMFSHDKSIELKLKKINNE